MHSPQISYLDTLGLSCPEPLMMIRQQLYLMQPGELLIVACDDPASYRDIPTFCRYLHHTLQEVKHDPQGYWKFHIQKGRITHALP